MKRLFPHILLAVAFTFVLAANLYAADMVVIVNKGNTNDVNKHMIEKIYTGDMSLWPNGGGIAAIDLPEDSTDRTAFTSMLLGKSVSSLKAQWAAKLFSGRATPPKVVGSDDDVKRAVAGNKNAVGYIKATSLDDSVKAVVTLR